MVLVTLYTLLGLQCVLILRYYGCTSSRLPAVGLVEAVVGCQVVLDS